MISSATASASQGLQANLQMFQAAAAEISNPDHGLTIENAVQLKQAEHGMQANAAVLSATYQVTDHMIDLIA